MCSQKEADTHRQQATSDANSKKKDTQVKESAQENATPSDQVRPTLAEILGYARKAAEGKGGMMPQGAEQIRSMRLPWGIPFITTKNV
jgi:hypothetical protein